MARYSEDREINREIKYLYKTWSKVDSQIELPKSLTAEALLPLIEDIPAPRPKQPHREIKFSPRVFSWKSGLTYAAALVLIVALSAVVGRMGGGDNPAVIVPESIPGPVEGYDGLDSPDTPVADPADPATTPDTPNPSDTPENPGITGTGEGETAPDYVPPGTAGEGGLGGPRSYLFIEDEQYSYYSRSGSDVPVQIDVVSKEDETVAFTIKVMSMKTVEQSFLYGDVLTIAGPSLDDSSVVLEAYNLAEPGAEVQMLSDSQQGTLLAANLYKSYVNLITYTESEPGCEVIDLPNAVNDTYNIISVTDLDTQQSETVALRGAGGALDDVDLHNLNAFIEYDGEVTEENADGRYTAHIRLDGTNIELRIDGAD